MLAIDGCTLAGQIVLGLDLWLVQVGRTGSTVLNASNAVNVGMVDFVSIEDCS